MPMPTSDRELADEMRSTARETARRVNILCVEAERAADKLAVFIIEHPDPGSDALACISCLRQAIREVRYSVPAP